MGVASICAVTCVLKGRGFKPRRKCSKSTAALAAKVTVKSQQGWFSHQEMISRWKGNTNDAPQKQKPEEGHHTEIGGRARGTFDGNHLASPEPCAAIEFDPAAYTGSYFCCGPQARLPTEPSRASIADEAVNHAHESHGLGGQRFARSGVRRRQGVCASRACNPASRSSHTRRRFCRGVLRRSAG